MTPLEPLVALEGLHAIKHAVRFNATVTQIITDDLESVLTLADTYAPELRPLLETRAETMPAAEFRQLTAQPIHTHVLAYAERTAWTFKQATPKSKHPTVLLDDPRNSKNIGAVIRVAAAAGATGVMINGTADAFDPMAVRGAAGLQWAIPSYSSPSILSGLDDLRTRQPLVVVGLDADGETYHPTRLAPPTIFAFGSERSGLSDALRSRCDRIVSLPMRDNVSSLNLATCVSAVLYLATYAWEEATPTR